MILYKTALKEAKFEEVIDKSKFISYIKPVENREEADEFIKSIKKMHRDATHNVPAMVIGDKKELQWASDDGEPQGTAGMPILTTLINEDITNVAVVVTRYFGGKKLGTGGLVRAYTSGVKNVLDVAGLAEVKEVGKIVVRTDYTYLSALQNLEREKPFKISQISYEEKIVLECLTDSENIANIIKHITETTNGRLDILEQSIEISKI